jgi:hypothetical protein
MEHYSFQKYVTGVLIILSGINGEIKKIKPNSEPWAGFEMEK